jgi:hypothetical protein
MNVIYFKFLRRLNDPYNFCHSFRSLPDLELVTLNFSSATTPALILKTFEHHCEYKRTPKGIVLRPNQMGKWLVIFCDEINLPAPDNYGTQRGNDFFTLQSCDYVFQNLEILVRVDCLIPFFTFNLMNYL